MLGGKRGEMRPAKEKRKKTDRNEAPTGWKRSHEPQLGERKETKPRLGGYNKQLTQKKKKPEPKHPFGGMVERRTTWDWQTRIHAGALG